MPHRAVERQAQANRGGVHVADVALTPRLEPRWAGRAQRAVSERSVAAASIRLSKVPASE
ncbi:hypothetical protein GCM10010247_68040 [Streptomyces calvus]|nr:hypothetical protein GCM10010247_68040 [Streptomyces calvus]